MNIQLEKAILDSFVWPYNEATCVYGKSQWKTLTDVHRDLVQGGFNISEQETLWAIYELMADRSFDCFEDDPTWGIFRLAEQGLARRRLISEYLGAITFTRHDGRFFSDGTQVGCVRIQVYLNSVMWGDFPERYTEDIEKYFGLIKHSLCMCRRSNRQVLNAIRQEFGRQVTAA